MDDQTAGHGVGVDYAAIDVAFRAGDLTALRRAVPDPSAIPNGRMPGAIGHCLVYAIGQSPLAFIRVLLDLGADPNAPADDGFPSLISALGMTRAVSGSPARPDVDDIVRLLLARGADPNQRGVNDYTALHMAVAEGNHLAVQRLLDAGADPAARTCIDDCETPGEMAVGAGLDDIADTLARGGRPLGQRLRSGVTLDWDVAGTGAPVRRQHTYDARVRMWLADGTPVRPDRAADPGGAAADDAEPIDRPIRVNRAALLPGLFAGLEGMCIGGTRRLRLAPHVAYGATGVAGIIPPNAVLTVEVTVVAAV